ncbi:MAG: 50S ribosomal protein L23, partial [Endozoicomonas sp.]
MSQERIFKVLFGPHISEKATVVTEEHNQYVFKVAKDATKLEIKKAKAKSYHNYFLNLQQTFLQFENLIATRFYPYLRVAL